MLDLAKEAEQGGLDAINARLTELKEAKAKADRLGEPMEISKTQMRRELMELYARKNKMRWSVRMVKTTTEEVIKTNGSLSPAEQEARVREALPSFPTPNVSVPKRGSLRARVERANAPVFSTEGIVIKWANQLDAEYAESWPETVNHMAMGLARHRAPAAEQEAILDVGEFRNNRTQAYQSKRGIVPASEEIAEIEELSLEESSQKKGLKKVRGEILGMVKEAVAARAAKELAATRKRKIVAVRS